MRGGLWNAVHDLLDALAWIALLNLAIVVSALAGGVVLGAAPAAVAAAGLVRRRLRGEHVAVLREMLPAWRRSFRSANAAVLPLFAGAAALWIARVFLSAQRTATADLLSVACLVGAVALVVLSGVAVPLVAHYDVPDAHVAYHAARLVLANPLLAFLDLVVCGLVVLACSLLPALALVLASGLVSYLGSRFAFDVFARNERRLADAENAAGATGPAPSATRTA